jgi:TrmH family RNA methyltransferase
LDTVSIGKHNPRLVDVRKAVQRGTLTADGLLPIEGPRLIGEAHSSGLPIVALFVREDVDAKALPPATSVFTLDSSTFKSLQSTEHSQGAIALVKPRTWELADIVGDRAPITVLAELQDPGNVGTILRVSESFGAAGCIALSGTASIHNSKVTRASAGSVFRLPWVWDFEWDNLVSALKSRDIPIVGTVTSCYRFDHVLGLGPTCRDLDRKRRGRLEFSPGSGVYGDIKDSSRTSNRVSQFCDSGLSRPL